MATADKMLEKEDLQAASDKAEGHGDVELYIDPVKEKKLLLKLDLWLSPVMTLIFLCSYLDRSNIGNAASAGMTTDLGMTSSDLGNAVTLFYVFYITFEVPCSLALKKLRPSRMIPVLVFLWSIVVIGTGFVQTRNQLYAMRLLLGLFESGMFPCLALYISIFYKTEEQALRMSYMFVSAALSGAFGGLLAYGLLHMDGVQGRSGWRWLYIIEGCASIVVAGVVALLLPDDYESARFLTEEEREMMRVRALQSQRDHYADGGRENETGVPWSDIAKAALDPKLWISCCNQFFADICSFGLSSFLPLIIKSFGYDTVTTQLLTIPIYVWASAAYTAVSWISDRLHSRYWPMVPAVLVTAAGYAVNLGVTSSLRGVLYFSLFLIAPGIYIVVGINAAWLLNSHAGYHKRAAAIGLNQTVGNSAGFVVGQVFKKTVHGKYVEGLSFCLGSILLAGIGHFLLYIWLRTQNKKRDQLTPEQREHEIAHGKGGDFHPDYRYAL